MGRRPPAVSGRGGLGEEDQLTPDSALALAEAEHDRATRKVRVNLALLMGVWGVAWLAGFAIAFAASVRPSVVPWWAAIAVIVVLNAAGMVASFGQSIRRGRGIVGPGQRMVSLYLWAWPLAFAGVAAVDLGLAHDGLPPRLAPLLWPGSTTVTVGILLLLGGALFRDRVHDRLGVWMLATGAASVFAGFPANFAVLAGAGGGGLLAAAAWYGWQRKQPAA